MEYLIRFLARIKPSLSDEDVEDLMRRFSASLTHQQVLIRNVEHPYAKKFPRLRGGTEESMMKFMMKLYRMVGGGSRTTSTVSGRFQGYFFKRDRCGEMFKMLHDLTPFTLFNI